MHRLLPLLLSIPVAAQSEPSLQEAFAGRQVRVRIAMPACSGGVDIEVDKPQPLDREEYEDRLLDCGTALQPGARATVTAIVVKDKIIEFQLDGGGFRTHRDRESVSQRSVRRARDGMSESEKARIKRDERRAKDRYREERREADARDRSKALRMGSRFNIRVRNGNLEREATPEFVRQALAQFVEFD